MKFQVIQGSILVIIDIYMLATLHLLDISFHFSHCGYIQVANATFIRHLVDRSIVNLTFLVAGKFNVLGLMLKFKTCWLLTLMS